MYPEEMTGPYLPSSGVNMPRGGTVLYPNPPYHPEHPAAAYTETGPAGSSPGEMPGSPSHRYPPMGMPMPMPMPMGVPLPCDNRGPRVEMSLSIPDDRIGAIIGKGGDIITQLQTLVGVKIIISSRNEFEPGTRNRRVTIIGAPDAVQVACMWISVKERSMFYAPTAGMYGAAPYGWAVPSAWMSAPPSPPLSEANGYN